MRLKECRKISGFSLEDIANSLDISVEELIALEENPDPVLSERQIRKLSEAYQFTIEALFDDPIKLRLHSFIDEKRISLIKQLYRRMELENSDQILDKAHENLSIADLSFIGILMDCDGEPDEEALEKFVTYLTVMEALAVPVTTRFKDLNEEQLMAHRRSKSFMEVIASFRLMWVAASGIEDDED